MHRKLIIGLIAIAVGIYLIICSVQALHEIAHAKGLSKDIENFFTHNPSTWNPLIKFFGGEAQEEVSKHDVPVMIMLICGIALTVGGAVVTVLSWKKPER